MKLEAENLNTPPKQPPLIADVMAILPFDDKMEELIRSRSQLYTSYSVKDKEGKYRSVVDVDSVVELLRELIVLRTHNVEGQSEQLVDFLP